MAESLTTEDLRKLLSKRVLGPEEQGHRAFYLEEVELGGRRADAVSVGLWPSRGQLIEGYELKTNRRDWLREYEDHSKAEPAMAICDHFWLVTVPGVLQPGELPAKWGLLLAIGRNRHLKVEKPAPLLRKDVTHPVDRQGLIRLMRRVDLLGVESRRAIRDEVRTEAENRVGLDRQHYEDRVASLEARNRELQEGWYAFHTALGLEPWHWHPSKEDADLIGRLAHALRDGGAELGRIVDRARRLEDDATKLADGLNDMVVEASIRLQEGKAA